MERRSRPVERGFKPRRSETQEPGVEGEGPWDLESLDTPGPSLAWGVDPDARCRHPFFPPRRGFPQEAVGGGPGAREGKGTGKTGVRPVDRAGDGRTGGRRGSEVGAAAAEDLRQAGGLSAPAARPPVRTRFRRPCLVGSASTLGRDSRRRWSRFDLSTRSERGRPSPPTLKRGPAPAPPPRAEV